MPPKALGLWFKQGVGAGAKEEAHLQSCFRLQQGPLESHYLSMMRSVWELAAGAVAYLSTFGGRWTGREKTMIKSEWPGRLETESLLSMRETMRHRVQLVL